MRKALFYHIVSIASCALLFFGTVSPAECQSNWKVFTDDFETGDLSKWEIEGGNCSVESSAARTGQYGLEVMVGDGEYYCYKKDLGGNFDKTCYFSFDFDPGGVSIPPDEGWTPGGALRIAALVSDDTWDTMAALYVRESITGGYLAFLAWEETDGMHYACDTVQEFELADSWQRITIALEIDSWVKAWSDDALKSEITVADHAGANVHSASIGKIWDTDNGPSGAVRFDNVSFELPRIEQLWVDASQTDCAERDGLCQAEAFCTIQEAADLAGPGTVVHILPGTYNEHAKPGYSGENDGGEYIVYQAEPVGAAVIDATGLECDGMNGVFEIYKWNTVKRYIKVVGLAIENPVAYSGCGRDGIYMRGAKDIVVSQASVRDSSGLSPVASESVGIYIVDSENVTVSNCSTYNTRSSGIRIRDSRDVVLDGNDVQKAVNGGQGECIAAAKGATRFEIKNNTIHNGSNLHTGGEGIDIKNGASSGSVHHNYIYDLPGEAQIYVDAYVNGVSDVEVYSNLIECAAGGGTGIALASEQYGLLSWIRVYNNVVRDCSGAGIEVADWSNDGMKTHIRIASNTVYNNGSTWGGGIFVGSDHIEDVVVSNNIASDNGRWQIGAIPESLEEVSGSHNLVYGDLDEGEEYGPDCGWDECYEFAGTSRIFGAPAFASIAQGSYDFHLTASSPAVDSGTAAMVDYDFDGETEELSFDQEWTARPLDGDLDGTARADRGAYEFDPYEDKTWTGDSDEHWNTPGNWEPAGVPGNLARVLVPDVSAASGRFPVVSAVASQSVAILEVGPGASLSVASTMSLNVLHSLTAQGLVKISGLLNMP